MNPLKKIGTLRAIAQNSMPAFPLESYCTTVERPIELSYCLETGFCPFFAPNCCMIGAITPILNPSLSFVIWNLVVQCQIDLNTYIQVIVLKLQKCLFLALNS